MTAIGGGEKNIERERERRDGFINEWRVLTHLASGHHRKSPPHKYLGKGYGCGGTEKKEKMRERGYTSDIRELICFPVIETWLLCRKIWFTKSLTSSLSRQCIDVGPSFGQASHLLL